MNDRASTEMRGFPAFRDARPAALRGARQKLRSSNPSPGTGTAFPVRRNPLQHVPTGGSATHADRTDIPLQTRLIYRIGLAHGYTLDRRHITDFLATVGVGLTSQYVEQFGRKLIGGLLSKVLGKTGKTIGSAATGSAFSFASTYALGYGAKQYYGGGRCIAPPRSKPPLPACSAKPANCSSATRRK